MKKILWMIAAMSAIVLVGCENEEDPGGTAVMKLSNEWWGKLYLPDGSGGYDDLGLGYQHLLTSSTSSGTADSIFIDDFDGLMTLKAKVACNVKDLTFTTNDTAVPERYTTRTVKIANGKVFPDKGHSTSGVLVDSIYFEVEFSDDPGTFYSVAGHGRTGFPEDEH